MRCFIHVCRFAFEEDAFSHKSVQGSHSGLSSLPVNPSTGFGFSSQKEQGLALDCTNKNNA
jgi:hypothetical protein